jgi:hypothetical protein
MKIGIITVSRTNNFGAELQAYALHKKLNNLGHSAEVIDYLYYKNKDHRPTTMSKPLIQFSFSAKVKNTLLYQVILPFTDIFFPLFHQSSRAKIKNFKEFHILNSKFSFQFDTIEKLYNFPHDYDVYITGSDQVWNPSTFTSLKPYFLDFAPKNKIKISYAASFGVSKLENKNFSFYQEQLNNLDFISVRESSGNELVNLIAHRNSHVVLDPTLLLNKSEWKGVVRNLNIKKPPKYLLIYQLHDSEELISIANRISEQLDLPILNLCKRAFYNKIHKNMINISDAGPSEFIELFYHADYVITNSFHGTIFSVNFNIPFYSVLNSNRKNNSRMIDFLHTYKLTDRIVWEGKGFDFEDSPCNFDQSNQLLQVQRENSIKFLLESFQSNNHSIF